MEAKCLSLFATQDSHEKASMFSVFPCISFHSIFASMPRELRELPKLKSEGGGSGNKNSLQEATRSIFVSPPGFKFRLDSTKVN